MKYTPDNYTFTNSDLNVLAQILSDSSIKDPHDLINYWMAKLYDPSLAWSEYEANIPSQVNYLIPGCKAGRITPETED